jgi:hypothetical protein
LLFFALDSLQTVRTYSYSQPALLRDQPAKPDRSSCKASVVVMDALPAGPSIEPFTDTVEWTEGREGRTKHRFECN